MVDKMNTYTDNEGIERCSKCDYVVGFGGCNECYDVRY